MEKIPGNYKASKLVFSKNPGLALVQPELLLYEHHSLTCNNVMVETRLADTLYFHIANFINSPRKMKKGLVIGWALVHWTRVVDKKSSLETFL